MNDQKKLSTEPYKGVRDFYPSEWKVQQYIFTVWRNTLQSFGYSEYNASILESTELYKAKSGEEIINDQTYSFIDRGDRDVTLRPEMTPTIARMVAAKKRELSYPLRWFSIPNLFRYERPQRGRLREHWQLNADIFGVDKQTAEIELICIASVLMKSFGLDEKQFEIRISSRRLLNALLTDWYELNEEQAKKLQKLIDRKSKISIEDFQTEAEEIVGGAFTFLSLDSNNETSQEALGLETVRNAKKEIDDVISKLSELGVKNVRFDNELIRGFDYYTGIIFEVFDTDINNRRSLFGGGRYDELLSLFGGEQVSAAGFGMGDVTIKDTLETYKLLPDFKSETRVYLCTTSAEFITSAFHLASILRQEHISVGINLEEKKLGDQIKHASKEYIRFIIIVGEEETSSNVYTLKNIETGDEIKGSIEELAGVIKNSSK